jgi:hypothetical protein
VAALEGTGHRGPISPQQAKAAAQALASDPVVKPAAPQGRPKKGDNVTFSTADGERGNSAPYLVRRLKRDNPEIAEALARGEYKIARAAEVEEYDFVATYASYPTRSPRPARRPGSRSTTSRRRSPRSSRGGCGTATRAGSKGRGGRASATRIAGRYDQLPPLSRLPTLPTLPTLPRLEPVPASLGRVGNQGSQGEVRRTRPSHCLWAIPITGLLR